MSFFSFLNNPPYVAIIGDIVKSKKLDERNDVQKKLQQILEDINTKYYDKIASKFMITLGDEFQGLLKYGDCVINIINELETRLFPVEIRFGIGVGEIYTDINPNLPLGADGPAYYNARKMIEDLKKMSTKTKTGKPNIRIASQGDNAHTDLLLNAIFLLSSTIKHKWSKRQREMIIAYSESDSNQTRAAQNLGIKQSSVNKGLANAGYYSYINALEAASKALSEIKEKKNV
ncbi:MAG: SatD family protein [Peptococcia bacterium]|jgi:hypothetical protein